MQGAEVIRDIHSKLNDKRLSTFAVFIPMVPGDASKPAADAAKALAKANIPSFWDGERELGKAYADVVSLPGKRSIAWDVYFVYGSDAIWGKTPPKPDYWMHQLGEDDRCLDTTKFRAAVEQQLKRTKPSKKLALLTRQGCTGTAAMQKNLDAALKDLGEGWSYEVVSLDKLPTGDLRRGYPTPTLLRGGKDVFGMPEPKGAADSPG